MIMTIRILVASIAAVATVVAPSFAGVAEGQPKFSREQQRVYLGEAAPKSAIGTLHRRDLKSATDRVVYWHEVALDAVAADHTPNAATGAADLAQGGPGRTSRALAIAQIAVYDAANAFTIKYNPYNDIGRARAVDASLDAAIAYAAHDVLVALYPGQAARFDGALAHDLAQLAVSKRRRLGGKDLGKRAAAAILSRRSSDHSQHAEPSFGAGGAIADGSVDVYGKPVNGGSRLLFEWEPDPNAPSGSLAETLALGAKWGAVTPFVLASGKQFRAPPPPAPGAPEHIAAFSEVASIGGAPDNAATPSTATPATIFIGNYWGYDGAPKLGTPPRMYGGIARQVALARGLKEPLELARYLALVHVAMADAGVAVWDSKYFYNYWRPVTGVRRDDGVAETTNDPTWNPVGVSVVNTTSAIRVTPPFPAYPSGHAAFGAATFEVMRAFFGDRTPFTFVSGEYDGTGVDPFAPGELRPWTPVRYRTLSAAQAENGVSRIYNGVHWAFDNSASQKIGVDVSRYLLKETTAFRKR